jgi:hypothetical protein
MSFPRTETGFYIILVNWFLSFLFYTLVYVLYELFIGVGNGTSNKTLFITLLHFTLLLLHVIM